jgi:hypothetical protein
MQIRLRPLMWCQTNHTRDYVTVGLEHHGSRAIFMAHLPHGLSCPAQALREAVMLLQNPPNNY